MGRNPVTPLRPTHVVRWSLPALADLDNIHDFVAQAAPAPAFEIREALLACARSLEVFPRRGVVVGSAYKLVLLDRYVLRYRVRDADVVILSIRDGRRRTR